MKWIKQLVSKWQLRELKRECSRASPFMANRALCHKLLLSLQEETFSDYQPQQAFGKQLNLQYRDMEELVQKIRDSIRLIKEGKMIPLDWSSLPESNVGLDFFISTQTGFYCSPATTVRRFKKHALELCELMVISDTETVGLPEHNLRMLTKLFIDIRTLTLTLMEVSSS